MSELAIFSAPKPFIDPLINTIQRNAIQSWKQVDTDVEVYLVGDEEGVAQAAEEYAVHYVSDVGRNDTGTPLVSSIFSRVREQSNAKFLLYVNADILLFPDALETIKQVARLEKDFLIVGQRWDMDIDTPQDFSSGWSERFKEEARINATLHPPAGSDYFIFPRKIFTNIPDFAIGRAGWDNWMIYEARRNNWLVVDATPSMLVIHQNHDYRHLPGGKPHYLQQESFDNEALAGGASNLYMILDCDKQLVNGKIKAPPITVERLLRRAEIFTMPENGRNQPVRKRTSRTFRRWRRKLTGSL